MRSTATLCSLFALASLGWSQASPVQLSLASVDDSAGVIAVDMLNTVPVAGFQFDLLSPSGAALSTITQASGGTAAAAGFFLGTGQSGRVLGFSFQGATIPAGTHQLLVNVDYTGPAGTVCLSNVIISDSQGNSIPADAGPCVTAGGPDCNGNGIADPTDIFQGRSLDLDAEGTPDECQPFSVDTATISLSSGGSQVMNIEAGTQYGGDVYLVLGSASGSSPGYPLGSLTLPLNLDAYTLFTANSANAGPFSGTFGLLDGAGSGTAAVVLPPNSAPSLVGLTVHHAYVVVETAGNLAFASNAMPLTLVL